MNADFANIQPLNAGSYGDIYLAFHVATGQQVVIKYLRDGHIDSVKRAFRREVKILSRQLPGIVELLASDLNANPPYYVMPYLRGPLTAYAGRLNSDQLRAVATELATALASLHGQYISHGDIKPDNILVSWDGHLRVADPLGNGFGCTAFFSQNHGGTPGYWAPEVRRGAEINVMGDAYSLGATLYELATGQRPQDGLALQPGPWVDSKIREIVLACCNQTPTLRPNMTEVIRLLRGESWSAIQERKRQNLIGLCVVGVAIGGLFLLSDASKAT